MHPLVRTARTTGLLYLGVAISGMLSFLVVRTRLFEPADPAGTLANLVERTSLARAGVVLELLLVLTQALTAVWFYRLFRSVEPVAAACIAAFGMVNAVVLLVSTATLGTAVAVAADPIGDPAATVQLMYLISDALWMAGNVFFGLWLVPMGWCAIRSNWMPRALGWILIAGGVGYVISGFIGYAAPDWEAVNTAVTVPASVGEFWMIGYLLLIGVNSRAIESP